MWPRGRPGLIQGTEGCAFGGGARHLQLAAEPVQERPHGESWELCEHWREFIAGHLGQRVRLTKIRRLLLKRDGIEIPYSTLHRFAREVLGFGRRDDDDSRARR